MADCVLIVSITIVRLVKASSYLGLTATPSLQQGVDQGKTPPSEVLSLPGAPWSIPVQQPDGRPGGRKPTRMQAPAVRGSPCSLWSSTRGPRSAFKVS